VTPPRDVRVYLEDILDAARKVLDFTAGMTLGEFTNDARTTFAVIRAFEIIGEAAKSVPDPTRSLAPEVPWQDMAGMRDKLIHVYHAVDLEVVWRAATEDLPAVTAEVARLLESLDDAG
jgi:uncharacterized protein with HEPN domain